MDVYIFKEITLWQYLLCVIAISTPVIILFSLPYSPLRQGKRFWKKWDLLVLVITSLALLSLTEDQNRVARSANINNITNKISSLDNQLPIYVEMIKDASCIEYSISEFSPSDIQLIIDENNKMCPIFKSLSSKTKFSEADLAYIKEHVLKMRSIEYNRDLARTIVEIIDDKKYYKDQNQFYLDRENRSNWSGYGKIFAPLLFCLAIALRIPKNIAEIYLEEPKAINKTKKYWRIILLSIFFIIVVITLYTQSDQQLFPVAIK